jgi:hypothetical protein
MSDRLPKGESSGDGRRYRGTGDDYDYDYDYEGTRTRKRPHAPNSSLVTRHSSLTRRSERFLRWSRVADSKSPPKTPPQSPACHLRSGHG